MDRKRREQLRADLRRAHPWVDDPHMGPSAVEAGECEHCGAEARLVATCGPGGAQLGRRCALAAGEEGWCPGHADEGALARAWLRALPPEADVVARLWWVATGEIGVDPALRREAERYELP